MASHIALATTLEYATLLAIINDRMYDGIKGLDPATTTVTNQPTNAIRWNSALKKDQRWDGANWIDKVDVYAISISGLAATATALATPRTINGVSFNGTGNISINLNNSISLSNAGDGIAPGGSFNGSANRIISYNSVGAPSAAGAGALGTWNISILGNAATVSGGAYLAGSQTFTGVKTFSAITKFAAGTAAAPSISFGDDDTGLYNGGANNIGFSTNGVKAGEMTAGGHLVMVGNVTSYSDERLKKNWAPLVPDVCGRLSTVLAGTFDRVDVPQEGRFVGVSAQSLQEVIPEAVMTDENGLLSVAYGPAALALCVELAKEIISLRQRIANLEKSNAN
jgi:hypothetical protein